MDDIYLEIIKSDPRDTKTDLKTDSGITIVKEMAPSVEKIEK
jgi:hypothetical protein